MKRIALTDDTGRWFDADKAEKFEGIKHDRYGEWLYFTASGKFILNSFTAYEGSIERYEEINPERAAKWLVMNNVWDHVPAKAKEIIASLEI